MTKKYKILVKIKDGGKFKLNDYDDLIKLANDLKLKFK